MYVTLAELLTFVVMLIAFAEFVISIFDHINKKK